MTTSIAPEFPSSDTRNVAAFFKLLTDKTQRQILFNALDIYLSLWAKGAFVSVVPEKTLPPSKQKLEALHAFKRNVAYKGWQALPALLHHTTGSETVDFTTQGFLDVKWMLTLWKALPAKLPIDDFRNMKHDIAIAYRFQSRATHLEIMKGIESLTHWKVWMSCKGSKEQFALMKSMLNAKSSAITKITRTEMEDYLPPKLPIRHISRPVIWKHPDGLMAQIVVQVEGITEAFYLQCLSNDPKTLQEYETVSQLSQKNKEFAEWLDTNWETIPISIRDRLKALTT